MDIQELQDEVQKFIEANNLDSPLEYKVLDLTSEVGEVSKEILKMTNYGKEQLKQNEEIALELGDVMYSLIVVANKLDVDLAEALNLVLAKYQRRLKKGSAGSEVDNNQP